MRDRVIATIATQQSRAVGLNRVINDILPQVDELHVYLNNYRQLPDIRHDNLFYYDAPYGDIADNGKFILNPGDYRQSYFAMIDDDMFYPHNYIETLVTHLEREEEPAVISLHGCVLHGRMRSYYRDRIVYGHTMDVDSRQHCHVIGTGCMMFHTSQLKYYPSYFIHNRTRMSDLLFSACAMNYGLNRIVVPHSRMFLRQNIREAVKDSISLMYKNNDIHLVEFISQFAWWK